MALDESFKDFVFDQLSEAGDFEAKRMFGGIALLNEGKAFAKIKHDKVWLKVDEDSKAKFEALGMQQYTYGKDGSRKLKFFETPVEVLEDRDEFLSWIESAIVASKK